MLSLEPRYPFDVPFRKDSCQDIRPSPIVKDTWRDNLRTHSRGVLFTEIVRETIEVGMESYRIQFLSEENTILIEYHGDVYYRTLLKSLDDLLRISMMNQVHLILDFREITNLYVGYRQLMNFRTGLNVLLPKKAVKKMAIINPARIPMGGAFCSTNKVVERNVQKCDMRCFEADSTSDVYRWLG